MAEMRIRGVIDTRNYEQGVNRMRGKNKKFGTGLDNIKKRIGMAFKVTAILMFARAIGRTIGRVVSLGSEINDLSRRTGVSAQKLQEWTRAAEDGGGTQQNLVNALDRVRDSQGQLIDGNEKMERSLDRLGITTEDFISMSTEEAFAAIAKSITEAGNSADRMNAASDILGRRNVPQLVNAMNAAANGTDEFGSSMRTVTQENAARLDALGNGWRNLGQSIRATSANIFASALAGLGLFEKQTQKGIDSAKELQEIEKSMREDAARQVAAEAEQARLDKLEEIRKKEEEIAEQQRLQMEKIVRSVTMEIDTDSIRRIGGFAGAQVSEQLRYARQQTQIMQKLQEYQKTLPQIERNTREGGLA